MKVGLALKRTWELATHRATPGVFQHEAVSITEDIVYMLAVKHKFILHQAHEHHDIGEAKLALRRTVRNRWFFRSREIKEFIPELHVRSMNWAPPKASLHALSNKDSTQQWL